LFPTLHGVLLMLQSSWDTDQNGYNPFELVGARPHYTPDRPGQVEHIFLDLDLDVANQRYQGTCSIRLNPIRSDIQTLTLDAINLEIHSVLIGRAKQPFDYDGQQLRVHLKQPTRAGKPITLGIAYAVDQPQRGIYFIAPTPDYPDKPVQVWTQGEDEDSRFWFPCFDYPGQLATSEIRARVPQPYLAISNGELIETVDLGDQKIYHWLQRQVHPTYLMTLAVGDFTELQDHWQGVPVSYCVEKGREEDARRSLGKTPRMIEFLSQKYGVPYPYPKYAQVCVDDFIFGGMENTSTTLLTDRCLLDERAALDNRSTESLVVHELAHQWFGDLVVIKHWSHAWLKEGMASYSEVMWTEQEYGPEEAAYYRLNEARAYFAEDRERYRRPVVTHIYREAIELYDRHIYEKGACVYHMIRAELGEELFWQAIQTFVRDNAHQTVETVDLLRAIEKATGRNLMFLFDQYVYRGGYPEYKLAYTWDGDSRMAKVTLTQTQIKDPQNTSQELFDLKLGIGFGYTQAQREKTRFSHLQTFTVRVHEQEQSFFFSLPDKPQFISFDPGNAFLKQVVLEYPLPELKAQLQFDPDPLSRIYAAEALVKKGGLEAVKVLAAALQQDSFWGVRAEVAKQLGQIKLDQAFTALKAGLRDADPRVRRAAVEAIAGFKTPEALKAVKPLAEKGDPSYYTEATALRAVGTIAGSALVDKDTQALKLLKSALKKKAGWNETVRAGAIAGLSQMKTSPEALDLMLTYTERGVPQPLRLAAIRGLGAISTGQEAAHLERILERLSALSGETFFLTQVAVVTALSQMETSKAVPILQALSAQTPDGRVRRLADEGIAKVRKQMGPERGVKQLQQDLEQLRQDNQALRSRLEALESKTH